MTRGIKILLLLLTLSSCMSEKGEADYAVSVTILPQKYLADKIVGDKIDVYCTVEEGFNPEEYDATPRQISNIANSDIYFEVGGLGFEQAILPSILANIEDIKLVTTSTGISVIGEECRYSHHHHCLYDPHVWSSLKCTKIMAQNIYDEVAVLDSLNADFYKENFYKLIAEIDSADAAVSAKLVPHKGEQFAIYHPSLTYFANDYGLKQLALEETGRELSPKSLQQIVAEAKNSGVKTIFIQNEFSPDKIEVFARELGVEVVVINPLSYHFIKEITDIADAIAK